MEKAEGGWGQLLLSLISQFLLLRDFFGYFLPGLIFVLLLGYPASGTCRFFLMAWLPIWLVIFVAGAVCYISGHLMAAAGYFLQDAAAGLIRRVPVRKRRRARKRARLALRCEPMILYFRSVYPQLFTELDRRDTLALLRTGLGAAFIIGCWLWPFPYTRMVLLGVGVAFLASGYAGRQHVALYRVATLRAAIRTRRNTA